MATKYYTTENEPKSLGLTSAVVGQIPKIAAVDSDGKPTAWGTMENAFVVELTVPESDDDPDSDGAGKIYRTATSSVSYDEIVKHIEDGERVYATIKATDDVAIFSTDVLLEYSGITENPFSNIKTLNFISIQYALLTNFNPIQYALIGKNSNGETEAIYGYLGTMLPYFPIEAYGEVPMFQEGGQWKMVKINTLPDVNAEMNNKLLGVSNGKWGVVDTPTVPESLKNPNALTIKIGDTTVTYDGSSAQSIEIEDGSEVGY